MNLITENLLKSVVSEFEFKGQYVGIVAYGSGHINDTFAVYFQFEDCPCRYILQRINTNVFHKPIELMENIQGVTSYLFRMITVAHGDPFRETLNLIPTKEGSCYYEDPEGGYWRAYLFVEDTVTLQQTRSTIDFYNSARSLGKFQMLLADYPAQTLHETIALFHNTPNRVRQFKEALVADTHKRADGVEKEIDFILQRESFSHVLVDLLAQGKLPLRVTHNDTKLNNILIDKITGLGICIIDLDTVMPGLSLYDFGDSIRFGATTAAEDEQDLSKVNFDIDLFKAFTKGYLETAGNILTDEEIRNLPIGAKMMTLECGIRFLTDYLDGDIYFKTDHEGQNLDRCRTQFKLVAEMEEQWTAMVEIVDEYRK